MKTSHSRKEGRGGGPVREESRATRKSDSAQSVLLWFGADLRLAGNPALVAALATGLPVIPVFLWHDGTSSAIAPGAASRWWLHQSLKSLDVSLRALGSRLIIRNGPAAETLRSLAQECHATRIFSNRVCAPDPIAAAPALQASLRKAGLNLEFFNASLLFEPGALRTTTSGPFRVFTPFWRALQRRRSEIRKPLPTPKTLSAPSRWPSSLRLDDLALQPHIDWAAGIRAAWTPGEASAHHRLKQFARGPVAAYAGERDLPERDGTSRLSPHLHFGELSPVQIWHALNENPHTEPYLRQIAWREFSYHLLCQFPETPREPFHPEFRHFPWRRNQRKLQAWQQGRTGYPFIDAAMRQLWHTGWMHNRARLAVASFLVKHLLIPWQDGAAWFLDTLIDADLANNTMGWQWTAGCGADAAPYFRIFNPVLQGKKFDNAGDYVRRWVPELKDLPSRHIHEPWTAPQSVLQAAGVRLGHTYPRPIVDHAAARKAALAAFAEMKAVNRRGKHRTGPGS